MAGERPDYNQLAAIQGLEGTTLRVVAVDASGQIIMVPRGAGGNYMSVDASGYLSSIMKGLDGVTLRTIAVDGSGNILGLLQGDYMGTVKTLAVDAQGRMLAVLTDPEDVFGNPHYMGAAELAARLGSIDTFDRRGQVIFLEDFGSGTLGRWTDASFGPNSIISLTTKLVNRGAFSCKMVCGEAANNTATMFHYMSYPLLSRMGLEAAVQWSGTASFRFYWEHMLYTGAKLYYAWVRLDLNAETLAYLDSAGNWQVFATGIKQYAHMFRSSKLVVDFTTEKFVRFILDSIEYDLSAYGLYSVVNTDAPGYVIGFEHKRYDGAVTNTVYLDDVIATINE